MESPERPSFSGFKRRIDEVEADEEDATAPAYGFRGFASASSPPPTSTSAPAGASTMKTTSKKQSRQTGSSGSGRRAPGTQSPAWKAPNSFAARMMAKMGYVEGQGLGTEGQGIVNPVESVARPQGAGLGAVKEKSKQAKDEARREAARRGEVLEDSSDEERRARQKRKEARRQRGDEYSSESGVNTPKGPPRPRYRTAQEIEAEMPGLAVPSVLKSLIDATGREHKLLTSAAGLMTTREFVSAEESEALKIARRARNDLEAFADEWKALSDRNKYNELEEAQIVEDMDTQQTKIERYTALTAALAAIENKSSDMDLATRWQEITQRLEGIATEYEDLVDECRLTEVAVATVHPVFRESMEEWGPLQKPTYLVDDLRRLHNILSHRKRDDSEEMDLDQDRLRRSTTPYETMIYTIWLPRVRSAIVNEWNAQEPGPVTSLIKSWKDILPAFVYSNVLDQLIVPRLSAELKKWTPRSNKRQNGSSHVFPWWILEWLPYLDARHTDPKAPTGLLSEAKRKFRVLLDTWELKQGVFGGIEFWRDPLGSEFDASLRTHLLPRLARHLRDNFEVNPQNQDMAAFEDVLKWKSFFEPKVIGLLLSAEFFPQWHSILHLWLTSDPNYEEVGEWYSWWKTQIPDEINDLAEVADEWNQALEMMNLALNLGDKVKTDLPAPVSQQQQREKQKQLRRYGKGKKQPVKANGALAAPAQPQQRPIEEPTTFKDVVEEWCAEEGLIMIPLREAHVQTGHPLFRITASANGKGGVVVYLRGDVVFAQDKKTKEWDPAGLDGGLVVKAEGH